MRVDELKDKKIVVWGTGKEGLAAAKFVCAKNPDQTLAFVDEGQGPSTVSVDPKDFDVLREPQAIARALSAADVIVKSPGVSLYHPLLEKEKARGAFVTSLLNLWRAENNDACVIGVTGTKGKSTTASLLNHVLCGIGKKSAVLGNIGIPVTESAADTDVFVIEISSYQAANFTETCDIGVLTSLFPEHLDWHKSLSNYYRDKANLLVHSKIKIVEPTALATLAKENISFDKALTFNSSEGFHFVGAAVYNGGDPIGALENAFLLRAHNRGNVCAVLEAVNALGLNAAQALRAMKDYRGLPHRQYELGEKDGILYVDDSISTTPQSAIAAMEAYVGRPLTLIAGGFDREIDYAPLVDYVFAKKINAVVCLGASGKRIFDALKKQGMARAVHCASMQEAVTQAKNLTPHTGIILLSPGAPSYGMFKDFTERAESFSKECGF